MGCSTSKQDADDDLRHVSKALGGSGAPRKRVSARAGAVSRERQMSFIMKRQLERRPSGRRATITDDYEHAFVPKTAEQSAFLLGALQSHHIFEGAEPTGIERCVEALAPRVVQPGETLVEFGARGHEFFIVGTGLFECFLPDKANEGEFVSSGTFAAGECFGELALLYGGRRAATVTASTKGEDGAPLTDGMTVWTISADVFQNTLSAAMQGEKARRLAILQQVPLFHTLSEHQLNRLCETAQRVFFPPDTTVIKKGDAGGTMYVIVSGSVEVSELSSNFTKMTLGPGKLFGEKGALTEGGATRDSTAVTADDTVCLAMTQRSLNLGGAFNELAAIITGHGDEVLFHHLQLLDGMPGEGKRELRKACKMVSYDAADEIFVQGELGATFYIMKEGRAKVRRAFQSTRHLDLTGAMDAMAAAAAPSFEGRGDRRLKRSGTVTADVSSAPKQAGGRLIAGDFFGDDALEDATGKGKMRQTTIIAETKCTCFEISADKFTKLTRKWQGISKKVARHYIRRRIELAMSVPASYIDLLDLEPVSVLGTGAYGRVRLSRQKLSGDPFAVKVMRKVNIRSKGDEQYVAQEIEVMKVMNHPFILRLAAAHHTDRNLYLVLEICVGGELFNFIHAECEDHRLEEKAAAFYVGCIVEALAHMHQQFIAYRDLKPENLLIDQEGYIKVVDFGFAKKIVGKTYSQVGTPEYYAPELVNPSKGHDHAVDLWALGIMLSEMVVGFSPFSKSSGDQDDMLASILECDYTLHKRFKSKSGRDLVKKLLQKDPNKRIGNGGAGMIDLQNHKWFAEMGIEWDKLLQKRIGSPWLPTVESPMERAAAAAEYGGDGTAKGEAVADCDFATIRVPAEQSRLGIVFEDAVGGGVTVQAVKAIDDSPNPFEGKIELGSTLHSVNGDETVVSKNVGAVLAQLSDLSGQRRVLVFRLEASGDFPWDDAKPWDGNW